MNANRLIATMILVAFAGCGGGSGGGSDAVPSPPPSTTPTSRATLVISVTDLLGVPVEGAQVRLLTGWSSEDKSGVTDAGGRVEISDVIDDRVTIQARTADLYGSLGLDSLGGARELRLDVVAHPWVAATGGIASAQVDAGGVKEDGRVLEFTLGIVQVPDVAEGEYWAWGPDAVRVTACSPDPANDSPRFRPDCVGGLEGFDAAYEGFNEGRALAIDRYRGQGYDPLWQPYFASVLLLDQGGAVAVSDPGDDRLFAAKTYLASGPSGHHAGLAAFAADDSATGQSALIPQQPVTLFPVENPILTTAGRELFPSVDALAALEGGGAPLYAALDRMVDFVAGHRDELPTIVVVTDGNDSTCGTYSECRARRESVLQKARANNVRITTVGLATPGGSADREALGALAQGSHGGERAAFWTAEPRQLSAILSAATLHQRFLKDVLYAKFRIQSATAGTFAPGRTVLGIVRLEVCPFECTQTGIPFTVEIP